MKHFGFHKPLNILAFLALLVALPLTIFLTGQRQEIRQEAAEAGIYVSPGGTGTACTLAQPCSLEGARERVRSINSSMGSDIVVYLRGGTYPLSSTFQLTEADSGNNAFKVMYRNYPNETPILSGGTPITGWTLYDSVKNIYQTSVSPTHRFRQLYVNNRRAIRARTPNLTDANTHGPYYWATVGMSAAPPYTFTVDPSELANWENLSQVEVVMIDHWVQKRARMSSFSGGTISFLAPENSDQIMLNANQGNTPHYYENAYEFLDAGGEFYLNTTTNTLYYKPRPGENMASATVIAPAIENLLTITGASTTNMAHDIQISGITFHYSNWIEPSNRGYLNWQAGTVLGSDGSSLVPGALQLQNARNITIDDNTIQHTGAHGIVALDDTKDSIFDHNTVTDTSSGGMYLGLFSSNSRGNRVTNNTVEYGGMAYTDAVGILLQFAPYAIVNHNEVRYYRYTGISSGWDWTDSDTAATNIEIGYNLIHDVMLLHDDGGGIYSLGKIPNMNIHDNYIHTLAASGYVGGYPIAGLYLDNGSVGKMLQNNVLSNVPEAFYAGNEPNYGNTLQNNYYNSPLGSISETNTQINNTSVNGSNWPAAALAIIQAAGLPTLTPTPSLPTPTPTRAPTLTPTPQRAPYPPGSPPKQIPGTIQAEDYDIGGEGVSYHDTDGINQGGAYRSDGVDVKGSSDTP